MARNPFQQQGSPFQSKARNKGRQGQEVSKHTRAVGKRIGGALKAEFARAQKRRDAKRR